MRKAVLRVGLTGGIGSGKSTICGIFSDLCTPIIDADTISHDVVNPGKPAYTAIVQAFGPDIVEDDGKLKRRTLRDLVFDNADLRKQLESIIHPMVYEEIEKSVGEVNYPYCIISIPLLLETNSQSTVDRILVINLPEKMQIERACKRDKTQQDKIKKIIESQLSQEQRLHAADDVIYNNRDIDYLNKIGEINDFHLFLR